MIDMRGDWSLMICIYSYDILGRFRDVIPRNYPLPCKYCVHPVDIIKYTAYRPLASRKESDDVIMSYQACLSAIHGNME